MTATLQRPEIQIEDPAPTPKRRHSGRCPARGERVRARRRHDRGSRGERLLVDRPRPHRRTFRKIRS